MDGFRLPLTPQILTTGLTLNFMVNITLLNDTAVEAIISTIAAAAAGITPLSPGSGIALAGGTSLVMMYYNITRLKPAAIAAAANGSMGVATATVGRLLMITNVVVGMDLRLCQVWVYGTVDGGAGGARPGVRLHRATGRVAAAMGLAPLEVGGEPSVRRDALCVCVYVCGLPPRPCLPTRSSLLST